mmetsp:Transcript_22664/g.21833  ORF Transcript_22664/g.21833 Transcript_22664/m.21833 type:complete len:226 (+) Transcript_22664:394-1071(+)
MLFSKRVFNTTDIKLLKGLYTQQRNQNRKKRTIHNTFIKESLREGHNVPVIQNYDALGVVRRSLGEFHDGRSSGFTERKGPNIFEANNDFEEVKERSHNDFSEIRIIQSQLEGKSNSFRTNNRRQNHNLEVLSKIQDSEQERAKSDRYQYSMGEFNELSHQKMQTIGNFQETFLNKTNKLMEDLEAHMEHEQAVFEREISVIEEANGDEDLIFQNKLFFKNPQIS